MINLLKKFVAQKNEDRDSENPLGLPRILWVTNLMPPYRIPLWEAVGENVDLKVLLLEGDDNHVLSADRSHEWSTRDGKNFIAEDLKVLTSHTSIGNMHIAIRANQLWREVVRADVIVLGGWESPVYTQLLLLSKLVRKKIIVFHESTYRSSKFKSGIVRTVKSKFFQTADAVVVPGTASHSAVLDLGVESRRIFEGFNAVNMRHFQRNQQVEVGALAMTDQGGHRFIYVGRLLKLKRVHEVINAFARNSCPLDHLTIVGRGPEESTLRSLVKDVGAGSTIEFAGYADYERLPALMHAHHTLVLVSDNEVWGLVVNEALAAGLHVVISDQCGVSHSVKRMKGVYIWYEDEESLDEVLRRSAREWNGPIQNPEILEFTNERFAQTFLDSFDYVLRR